MDDGKYLMKKEAGGGAGRGVWLLAQPSVPMVPGLGVGRRRTCGKWCSSGLKVLVCRGCGNSDTRGLNKEVCVLSQGLEAESKARCGQGRPLPWACG